MFCRCQIPGITNDTWEIQNEYHASLLNSSLPLDDDGDYDSCSVYDVTVFDDGVTANRTTRSCNQWVYDQSVFTETIASQVLIAMNFIINLYINVIN